MPTMAPATSATNSARSKGRWCGVVIGGTSRVEVEGGLRARSRSHARGERLHHVQHALDVGGARIEVRFQEQFGQPGLRVAADVLADLVEASPQWSALP